MLNKNKTNFFMVQTERAEPTSLRSPLVGQGAGGARCSRIKSQAAGGAPAAECRARTRMGRGGLGGLGAKPAQAGCMLRNVAQIDCTLVRNLQ